LGRSATKCESHRRLAPREVERACTPASSNLSRAHRVGPLACPIDTAFPGRQVAAKNLSVGLWEIANSKSYVLNSCSLPIAFDDWGSTNVLWALHHPYTFRNKLGFRAVLCA